MLRGFARVKKGFRNQPLKSPNLWDSRQVTQGKKTWFPEHIVRDFVTMSFTGPSTAQVPPFFTYICIQPKENGVTPGVGAKKAATRSYER